MIFLTSHCRDERHEQDLLLFAHAAGLSPWRRWLMEAHLSVCPRCRDERDRLLVVSHLMAGAVRSDTSQPPWRPPIVRTVPAAMSAVSFGGRRHGAVRPGVFTRPLPAWAVVLVLALLLAGASVAAALVYGPTGGAFLCTDDALSARERDALSRKAIDPANPDCEKPPVRAAAPPTMN